VFHRFWNYVPCAIDLRTPVQWLRLAFSKGPNRVGVSHPLPEDGKRSSFQNVVFSSYLEFWEMDKVLKPSDSECYTPSSESVTHHHQNPLEDLQLDSSSFKILRKVWRIHYFKINPGSGEDRNPKPRKRRIISYKHVVTWCLKVRIVEPEEMPVIRQQLCKRILMATNTCVTREEAVFSVWSIQSL
jgi:hypothetical protein